MYQSKIKLIRIDESLRSINYEAKTREGKNKICSLYKSEKNFYKIWWSLIWCVRQCLEKCHIVKKRLMHKFVNVSFINDISRYIVTSVILRKE